MPGWVATIVAGAIRFFLDQISPALLTLLKEQVLIFAKKAKETDNPWDDMAASFLLLLLGVPKP